MINLQEVIETNKMIEQEHLDVRTITMGISLLDCADKELTVTCEKIYNKITTPFLHSISYNFLITLFKLPEYGISL